MTIKRCSKGNFCTGIGVNDIITCADLYYDRLRGLGVAGGQILAFSIDLLRTAWMSSWVVQNTKFIFKMADGRHIAKCWKCYNLPINGAIWMKLGWSHPTMSPTCPPWCGCHDNSRCIATERCTFSSYGRLEAERVNQFWWNLVQNSKLGPKWQSLDQILKI